MQSDVEPKQRRYKAFVSYSHRDKTVGARLFRIIDSYRPPKRLVGKAGAMGPVPAKLYPCFRDREELSSSRDVKTNLDEALLASDQLVVLCSPASAKSEWVAHEIRTFAAAFGIDRISAVVVAGTPESALPAALSEVGILSPLAIDLRPGADGWKDGSLKIISRLLGLPFAELRDRELARTRARRIRLASIIIGFVTLFSVTAGSAWALLNQSADSREQFVAFLGMLSGNLDKLSEEQWQSLDTTEAAKEIASAQQLYSWGFRFAPDHPDLLKEEARLQNIFAKHLMAAGTSSASLEAAEKASATLGKITSEKDKDEPFARLSGMAIRNQSIALIKLGREGEAIERAEKSARILRELPSPESRQELADTLTTLSQLEERRNNLHAAFAYDDEAYGVLSQLEENGPNRRKTDVLRLRSLLQKGTHAEDVGDIATANAIYDKARGLALPLSGVEAGDAIDLEALRSLYISEERLGSLALRNYDPDSAKTHINSMMAYADLLSKLDPENRVIERDKMYAYLASGFGAVELGLVDEARMLFLKALSSAQYAAINDPTDISRQADVINVRMALYLLDRDEHINARDFANLQRDRGMRLDLAREMQLSLSPGVTYELRQPIRPPPLPGQIGPGTPD